MPGGSSPKSIPLRARIPFIQAGHLVITGYGHWLPNDPRGSGSEELREQKLSPLGDVHRGRRPVQPTRHELRKFYADARPLLDFDTLWFDESMRQTIADAFHHVVMEHGFTVWACAVLRNHAHLVVRKHRGPLENTWSRFAEGAAVILKHRFPKICREHPIWSNRVYVVYLHDAAGIRTRIRYVENNPEKENLPRQMHPFVTAYKG